LFMPTFKYEAKNYEGNTVTGDVEAATEKHAVAALKNRGLVVTNITEVKEQFSLDYWLRRFQGVSSSDKAVMTRQLATMIKAGLPLASSLEILSRQTRNPTLQEVIKEALQDVEGGSSLSNSFAKYPKIFSPIFINLIRAGEASGSLDRVMERLANNMESSNEFKGKLRGAMIYPAIVFVFMIAVMVLMIVMVIPQLTSMYDDVGADLPMATQVLIWLSDFFINRWWAVLAILVGLVLGWRYFASTTFGKYRIAEIQTKLPVIGRLLVVSDITEFTRTLSLLVSSGLPILDSLEIVKGSVSNLLLRDAISQAAKEVERGAPLSTPLARSKEFPEIVAQMVGVGEETGKLDEVLDNLSYFFKTEADQRVKNLTTALEPIIMVFLGVMVAALIISIVTPMYQLMQSF